MRFIMIYAGPEADAPPSEAEQEAMGAFIGDLVAAGQLLVTDGLKGSDRGVRIRRSGGRITRTDGPFTESKEVVGGFAIVEVNSIEEAVSISERFMSIAGDGVSEIREMYDAPAFGEYRRSEGGVPLSGPSHTA